MNHMLFGSYIKNVYDTSIVDLVIDLRKKLEFLNIFYFKVYWIFKNLFLTFNLKNHY